MEFKLILKKINNTLTKDEEEIFQQWYDESEEHQEYFSQVKNNYYTSNVESVDVRKAWIELNKKTQIVPQRKRIFNRYFIAAASVAAILVLATGTLLLTKFFTDNQISQNGIIAPGSDRATLTLDDGQQISLAKGKYFNNSNTQSNDNSLTYSTSQANTQLSHNVLTTPRGGQFFVQLSDGTKIWLNAESQLRYPVKFLPDSPREVELVYGEAYFDVSPSTNHNGMPFSVHTKSQNIEVLGTEFNVKAYRSEKEVFTTLIEGKINVKNDQKEQIINPGQQSVTNQETLTINQVDTEPEIAWKNGLFIFDEMPLEEMMESLASWYDIEIIFKNEQKKTLIFSGSLKRTDNLNELLNNIALTGDVKFTISKKTITIE